MRLFHLAYVSRATGEVTESTLADIAVTAQRRNTMVGVTGLLLWSHGCFFQLLEGEPGAISRLFESIERDPRHTDVVTVYFGAAPQRYFSPWAMGVFNVDAPAVDLDIRRIWDALNTPGEMSPLLRYRNLIAAFERFRTDLASAAARKGYIPPDHTQRPQSEDPLGDAP